LKQWYGSDYLITIDHEHKMIFASNVDTETLNELKKDLPARADAMVKQLFTFPFEQYVTVIIPSAKTVKPSHISGFYSLGRHMAVARGVGWPVRHEFTHAVHLGDCEARSQSNHALWVKEGLATLFERSRFTDGKLVSLPGYRINQLKGYLKNMNVFNLSTFVRLDQKTAMKNAGPYYAMARNLMRYLEETGKLKTFYDTYVKYYSRDRSGRHALEQTVGKNIMAFEKDFHAWIRKQAWFALASKAYLGLGVEAKPEGLAVTKLDPKSPAAKEGIMLGDLLVNFNSERLADAMDIISALNTCKPNDKITIRLRRGDKYLKVSITLSTRDESNPKVKPSTTPKLIELVMAKVVTPRQKTPVSGVELMPRQVIRSTV
ncbi:MAG TPA: PDZ domain-containing protein, partial [Phycisphaerae bacterium]|nr:PDZ domain-containing protein [Phycisphaerae bacterium]